MLTNQKLIRSMENQKLSNNLSLKEAVNSYEAKKRGIANVPKVEHIANLKRIAKNVFQKVRDNFGVPIKVNSGFRSVELNKAIGGSRKSQHCEGEALDIDDTYGGVTNKEIFYFIKENLEFDQLIWEFGDEKNPDWVHVSYREGSNRKRVLKAVRKKGKVLYHEI